MSLVRCVLNVSSKGQIVLPVEMRKNLSLEAGDRLVAYYSGDSIVLKKLEMPTPEEFEAFAKECQEYAKAIGLKESDIPEIIKKVRSEMKK